MTGKGSKNIGNLKLSNQLDNQLKILNEVKEALKCVGIKQLNTLQLKAFEAVKRGNCLIVAPTGSGKTEAALVPAVDEVLRRNYKPVAIIYITPLRALNRDMLRRIEKFASTLKLKVAVRHGDTSQYERSKQSESPPHILVTTPETFQILFLGKKLRRMLRNVKFLIVDEVHELAQSERGIQLSVAVERLRKIADFKIIGLSATVKRKDLISSFLVSSSSSSENKINKIEIVEEFEEKEYEYHVIKPKTIKEDFKLSEKLFVDVDVASQIRCIKDIVEKHGSALIFVNTRQTAEALALKLRKIANVEVHHGSLSKDARIEAERKFVNGEIDALICTSSMELGIDIGHVNVVIQYNSPRQVYRLIQRVGRSGHTAGRKSIGYIVASTFDEIMESWVIVDRASKGEIEEEKIHEMSLDTLANQIAAIAMEYGKIDVEEVYELIRSAYPYRKLKFEEFVEICSFLSGKGVIGMDGNKIFARRKTRIYFYDNISMIPDEKKYRVIDVSSNRVIGSLDEVFVTTFRGEVFAMKGELWRIVDVGKDVYVEPVAGEGEVPSWVGEEIPVPFEVAQDVGVLRLGIKRMLECFGWDKTVKALVEKYKTNEEACKEVLKVIDKQDIIPSDKLITVEKGEGFVVVNACFGHTVNEVLGRILAMLLSARRATSVSVEIDPYRIKLYPASVKQVVDALFAVKDSCKSFEGLTWLAERALLDTKLLQWKVVFAARKFGIMGKNADITRMNLKNLVLKLRDTPIYKEALREIFTERFNLFKLREVALKFGDEIEILELDSLTPISEVSRQQAFDLLIPSKPTAAILDTFRKRIEREFCLMHCLNCGCTLRVQVSSVKEPIECIRCKSKMVACVNARRKLEDYKRDELFRIANLVMSYGKRAVYAMNTHGVGAENAARILSRYYRDDEEFFKELLEAEKRYIRTRKFWSVS